MRSKDEWPVRAIVEICEAVGEEVTGMFASHTEKMAGLIIDHYEQCHIPSPRRDPLQAVLWANERIPDVHLVLMGQALETGECTLEEVAQRFGYPISLVKRELAIFYQLHDRWIFNHARMAVGA